MHQQWHTTIHVNIANCNVSIVVMKYQLLRDCSLQLDIHRALFIHLLILSVSIRAFIVKFFALLAAIWRLTTGKSVQIYTVKLLIDEPCKWPQANNCEFKLVGIPPSAMENNHLVSFSCKFNEKAASEKKCVNLVQTRVNSFSSLHLIWLLISLVMWSTSQLGFVMMIPKIHSLELTRFDSSNKPSLLTLLDKKKLENSNQNRNHFRKIRMRNVEIPFKTFCRLF